MVRFVQVPLPLAECWSSCPEPPPPPKCLKSKLATEKSEKNFKPTFAAPVVTLPPSAVVSLDGIKWIDHQ